MVLSINLNFNYGITKAGIVKQMNGAQSRTARVVLAAPYATTTDFADTDLPNPIQLIGAGEELHFPETS